MDSYKNVNNKKTFQKTLKVEIDIKTKIRGYPTEQTTEWFLFCLLNIKGRIKLYQTLNKRNPVLYISCTAVLVTYKRPESIFGRILSSGSCDNSLCILCLYIVKWQEKPNWPWYVFFNFSRFFSNGRSGPYTLHYYWLYYGLILSITSFSTGGVVSVVDKQELYRHRQCYNCPPTGTFEILVDF